MALTNIEYGSIASSEVVNNNFLYLDDKIASLSQSLNANTTTINSSISSLSATVANNKQNSNEKIEQVNEDIDEINSSLKTVLDRVYLLESYNQGQNWYRLYSDKWIEQGGFITPTETNEETLVTLKKEMADLNGCIIVSPIEAKTSSSQDIGIAGATFIDTATISITVGRNAANGGVYWRVSGFVK